MRRLLFLFVILDERDYLLRILSHLQQIQHSLYQHINILFIKITYIPMDLFKAAINTGIQYMSNANKQEKLRGQLYHCTYPDDAKFVIEKSVKQVLHVYPHFETEILEFSESGKQKKYIEIKGIMEVEVRGKTCKVDYNMMIPNGFPRKAPYVRIINRNSQYQVNDFYKPLRSPTDPKSFILNEKLQEVRTWTETKSIVNIIIESHNLMRNNFPFMKGGPSNTQSYGQGNSGWQSTWANQPQQQQQQGYNQNNAFNNMMGGMGGFSKPPPIPFNSNQGYNNNQKSIQEVIANHQKFIGSSKKIIQKLKQEHISAIQKIQQLETIKYSLASQEEYLRSQNYKMNDFLRNSDTSRIQDLSSLIIPKDERSEQILDLTSSLKARDQCISLLESKFNDGEMAFDEFMKLIRKIEEDKFQEKVLLTKWVFNVSMVSYHLQNHKLLQYFKTYKLENDEQQKADDDHL